MECYWSEGAESKLCGWLLQLLSNTLFAQSGHMVWNKRRVLSTTRYLFRLVTSLILCTARLYILGPLLFLVYIDDIPPCITHDSKVAIFADDSKLFKIIEKPSDKFSLQQDLTQLSIWSDTWGMCLNKPKCKAMNISRKKIPTKREYHLNGFPLETDSVINTLSQWSQHIKLISSKAKRKAWPYS